MIRLLRVVMICLRDIPLNVRMNAAHRLCAQEQNPDERTRIFAAALEPSRRRYPVVMEIEAAA